MDIIVFDPKAESDVDVCVYYLDLQAFAMLGVFSECRKVLYFIYFAF